MKTTEKLTFRKYPERVLMEAQSARAIFLILFMNLPLKIPYNRAIFFSQ
jgi:hypothetical protein